MAESGLVHIIDDDDAVRGGLGSLVRSVGNDARLYGSTREFLGSELLPVPSCLLLDVRLLRSAKERFVEPVFVPARAAGSGAMIIEVASAAASVK
jgi:FixJ family two-component response regulator